MIIFGASLFIFNVNFALADSGKQPSLSYKIRLQFAFLDIFVILWDMYFIKIFND